MARSIIQAQSASPTFTHVYAALVSIVNTKVYSYTNYLKTDVFVFSLFLIYFNLIV